MKNAKRRVRSRSAKSDAAPVTPESRNAALAVIGILAAATLIAVAGVLQRSDSSIAPVPLAASAPHAASPAPSLDTTKESTDPAATAPVERVRSSDTSAAGTRVVDSPRMPAVEPTEHPDALPHVDAIPHTKPRLHADSLPNARLTPLPNPAPNAKATPAAETRRADVVDEGTVTISGCLEARDDSFWLKDPSGANAPTSRSWKSGFLKKHAEPVQVVDATRALQLSRYVAQRVSATGTLANRTIQTRSLERVAASCH